jgi:hypothetical protein
MCPRCALAEKRSPSFGPVRTHYYLTSDCIFGRLSSSVFLGALSTSRKEGGRRCAGAKRKAAVGAKAGRGGDLRRRWSELAAPRRRVLPALCDATGQRSCGDAQKQLGALLDAVVDAAPVNSAATLVSAADADVAGQVADAITATLQAHGCPRGKWQSHLLCGALAAVARAMKAGEDLAKTAVTKGVTAALVSSGIPRLAASLAARAAVDTLTKWTPVRHWEDVRRAVQVQLLAVSMCPNVADHPAVEQYCLRPLASQLLSDAIQEELAALPRDGALAAG